MQNFIEQRIEKYIASCGICSRRDATKLILDGTIKRNNELILDPSTKILQGDVVLYKNKLIKPQNKLNIWKYYKPKGILCTHKDPLKRTTVFDKLNIEEYVISVGRLDINSEGLLLITNNGEFARFMELPVNSIKRTYKVRAFGSIKKFLNTSKEKIKLSLQYNVEYFSLTKTIGSNHWFKIVLNEGKNREIRNIFQFLDLEVNRLIRISYGKYSLGKMKPGDYILC